MGLKKLVCGNVSPTLQLPFGNVKEFAVLAGLSYSAARECKRRLKSAAGVMCVTGRFKSAASSITMKHVLQYE